MSQLNEIEEKTKILLENLSFLGLSPEKCMLDYRVELDENLLRNESRYGKEIIFHFLISIEDPDYLNRFIDCWPIRLPKNDLPSFRTKLREWLKQFNDKEGYPKFSQLVLSRPDRCLLFLFSFTLKIMCEKIKAMEKKKRLSPALEECQQVPQKKTRTNFATTTNIYHHQQEYVSNPLALKLLFEKYSSKFLKYAQRGSDSQKEWIATSTRLIEENQQIELKKKELLAKKSQYPDVEKYITCSQQRVKRLKRFWALCLPKMEETLCLTNLSLEGSSRREIIKLSNQTSVNEAVLIMTKKLNSTFDVNGSDTKKLKRDIETWTSILKDKLDNLQNYDGSIAILLERLQQRQFELQTETVQRLENTTPTEQASSFLQTSKPAYLKSEISDHGSLISQMALMNLSVLEDYQEILNTENNKESSQLSHQLQSQPVRTKNIRELTPNNNFQKRFKENDLSKNLENNINFLNFDQDEVNTNNKMNHKTASKESKGEGIRFFEKYVFSDSRKNMTDDKSKAHFSLQTPKMHYLDRNNSITYSGQRSSNNLNIESSINDDYSGRLDNDTDDLVKNDMSMDHDDSFMYDSTPQKF